VSANVFAGSAYGFDKYFDDFIDVTTTWRDPRGLSPVGFKSQHFPGEAYLRFLLTASRHEHPMESFRNAISALLQAKWRQLPGPKLIDDGGRAVLRNARTLTQSTPEPWFLFLNLMDAHIPLQHFLGLDRDLHGADNNWSSSEYNVWELIEGEYPGYWETRESVYGAYIDYFDRLVTNFVEHIDRSTDHETTVVVTADHGENHGEPMVDGLAHHKSSLAEPLLHVPLVVLNAPDTASAPDSVVSLLDLPDLLSSLAFGEWVDIRRDVVPAELIGMSAGPEPPADMDNAYYRRAIRVCYRRGIKYEWDSLGGTSKYELDETRPSWQRRVEDDVTVPEWATEQFSKPLDEAKREAQESRKTERVSSAVKNQLESLGYR
jgi:arylsulfatase A-like enzyme